MKTRGFEKISLSQFSKDFASYSSICSYDDLKLPVRGTTNSAGYDFIAPFDFVLEPNMIIKIPTGIKVYMLEDEWLAIIDRSSVGFKYNVRLCNQIAVIDHDYYNNIGNEGHMFVALQNEGVEQWVVKKGEAYVQSLFMKYLKADNDVIINQVREGGIGSTNGGDIDG